MVYFSLFKKTSIDQGRKFFFFFGENRPRKKVCMLSHVNLKISPKL